MLYAKTCVRCGDDFQAGRSNALYCKDACRNAASRERRTAKSAEQVSIVSTLVAQLETTKQGRTPMGQALMVVARRLDRESRRMVEGEEPEETGSSLSALVLRLGVELQRLEAKHVPEGVEDEVAKARERRDSKRNAR